MSMTACSLLQQVLESSSSRNYSRNYSRNMGLTSRNGICTSSNGVYTHSLRGLESKERGDVNDGTGLSVQVVSSGARSDGLCRLRSREGSPTSANVGKRRATANGGLFDDFGCEAGEIHEGSALVRHEQQGGGFEDITGTNVMVAGGFPVV